MPPIGDHRTPLAARVHLNQDPLGAVVATPNEIDEHLVAMSRSTIWDIPRDIGLAIEADREWLAMLRKLELEPPSGSPAG
jgi:hypothetical protein